MKLFNFLPRNRQLCLKVQNLCSEGYNATLTLDAEDGKASVCLKANLGHVPPPFPSPQPSTSQRSLLLSPPGKEKSSAVTSNIIVDAEQVDTPDQAEQARNMLTVVSEQDQQETPKAEEAIDNSEMQEPVDLAEN